MHVSLLFATLELLVVDSITLLPFWNAKGGQVVSEHFIKVGSTQPQFLQRRILVFGFLLVGFVLRPVLLQSLFKFPWMGYSHVSYSLCTTLS